MPTLELLLDASGMQRGADLTVLNLQKVQAEASATEVRVRGTARQITSGMTQVSGAVISAAGSFSNLNSAAGILQSSHGLLGIANVVNDLRNMAVAASGVGASIRVIPDGLMAAAPVASNAIGVIRTAVTALGTAIKTNPIGIVAAALSTVALGMGLFGRETEKAKTKFEELADAIAKARLDAATASFLGNSTLGARQAGQQAIEQGLGGVTGTASVGDAAKALGLTRMDVIRYLSQQQGGDASAALEYIRTGRVTPYESVRVGSRDYPNVPREVQSLGLNNEQLRGLFRQVYLFNQNEISRQIAYDKMAPGLGPVGGGDTYDRAAADELYGDQRPGGGVRITAERQAQVNQENTERALQAMDELVAKGEQFGATIGNAFFNVASGTQTARQALQSLIADFARLASQQAFAKFFGTAFGATAPQQQQPGGWFSG